MNRFKRLNFLIDVKVDVDDFEELISMIELISNKFHSAIMIKDNFSKTELMTKLKSQYKLYNIIKEKDEISFTGLLFELKKRKCKMCEQTLRKYLFEFATNDLIKIDYKKNTRFKIKATEKQFTLCV